MSREHYRTCRRILAETSPHDAGNEWRVLLWDQQRSRVPRTKRIIKEHGARPCLIQSFAALERVKLSPACGVALVALGREPSAQMVSLQVIRSLKQKGFRTVCYEEGTEAWPLSSRCRQLLAGSAWLLDSSQADFADKLSDQLARALHSEAAKRIEEGKTKSLMKQLGLVGESRAMMTLFRWIVRMSPLSDLSILITGETGTGKELVARAIYQLDPKRCRGPLVVLNCGAINPWLAESDLFGHRRGAFTGAERERKGLIRAADGGVLFLDEIGELDMAVQTKLLRALQEARVLGVGEDREVPVDVRIVAATNRNLVELVKLGKFRADLFHRINVLSVRIPPLRERPADLDPLINHFLKRYQSHPSGQAHAVGSDFLEALARVELSGNARQLENIIRNSLVNKYDDSPLGLSDLPPEIWQELSEEAGAPTTKRLEAKASSDKPSNPQLDAQSYLAMLADRNDWNLERALGLCESLLIQSALRLSGGNRSKTARLLGITPRSVYNKVRKHRLNFD